MSRCAAWLAASEAAVPDGDGWLSPGERAAAAALRTPQRRRDWRLGRWTAKRAVGAVLGGAGWLEIGAPQSETGAARLEILAGADGSPLVFVAGCPAGVSVSISHRAGVAACLVTGPDVAAGCDLELVEPRPPVFARDWFTARELALVDAAGSGARDLVVTLVWSAKESALKALREGLRLDTRSVEVDLDLDTVSRLGWRPLAVSHGARVFAGWWRRVGEQVLTMVAEPPAAPPVWAGDEHR